MSASLVRIALWGLVASACAYDTCAMVAGLPTITATVRAMDDQTGTLLRWALLGIWFHLFIPHGKMI